MPRQGPRDARNVLPACTIPYMNHARTTTTGYTEREMQRIDAATGACDALADLRALLHSHPNADPLALIGERIAYYSQVRADMAERRRDRAAYAAFKAEQDDEMRAGA